MDNNSAGGILSGLIDQVNKATLPPDLAEGVKNRLSQLGSLTNSPTFLPEIDRFSRYIDWITNIPWNTTTADQLDLVKAKEILDGHHYGLEPLKDRLLEYLSVMKLNVDRGTGVSRSPILCFVGLVGTGKTTMAVSVAEAIGRKFARIPFGGMADSLELRGQSRMHPEAEPGRVVKALRTAGSRNPIILLDEIDRVTDQGRASIMGVLVELLDPEQNHAFIDHYIDYPIDLSQALFIATANNTTNIATAVMDRLEPISMPSYSDQEKIVIAKKYILPKVLAESGMPEGSITIDDEVWINIARPLGFDAGIRTLDRTVQGVVRKIAKLYVEGKGTQFTINKDNVKEYLPKW
ncbi:AAA family ATPase [Candidatus Woesebacteria bacterium]|jgi:ATP-dependent Lon protease|nr:AAA family ATPase [Candidatus Woesebacteria bacterium]MBP9687630.1 AAA family ATPase [Candidatus Woesebacteria bacterium]